MSTFKTRHLARLLAVLAIGFVAGEAAASVSLDFQVAFNPSDDVHVLLRATSDYYRPAAPDFQLAAAACQRPEEMAVVFFIARHSGAGVEAILSRRTRGESWMSIMTALKVKPDLLYLGLPEQAGPPYGKANGHRKNRSKEPVRGVVITDADVIDLVGLQVTAKYYRVDPMQVVEARRAGRSYPVIHGNLYRKAHAPETAKAKAKASAEDEVVAAPGRGQGYGRTKERHGRSD